jgi:hypothetical protein
MRVLRRSSVMQGKIALEEHSFLLSSGAYGDKSEVIQLGIVHKMWDTC